MARTPRKTANDYSKLQTLAELLFYLPSRELRRELESYRIAFEEEHGKTDLTKRYTSTWPIEQQRWLLKHDTKRYFDGFPPFAQAFLKGKMQIAAAAGSLDDTPSHFLRLFVSGQMNLDCERDTNDL
jgi:hypothetical protein